MPLRIAVAILAPLIALLGSGHHRTAAHIGRNAAPIEAAAALADRIAALPIPHIPIEAAAIARRDADPVQAVIATVWQTAGRVLIVAVTVLAHAGGLIGTEAILTAPM